MGHVQLVSNIKNTSVTSSLGIVWVLKEIEIVIYFLTLLFFKGVGGLSWLNVHYSIMGIDLKYRL